MEGAESGFLIGCLDSGGLIQKDEKIALQAGVGDREVESGQWEMGDFRSAAGSQTF